MENLMLNTNPKFIKVKEGDKIEVITIRMITGQEIYLVVETEARSTCFRG